MHILSLRTLWSAVIKSPNFSARSAASPVRFLRGALVILVPRQIFGRNRMIFNHCTKRNGWAFKRFSESPFVWSFLTRQEILNVSQIAIAFHGIRPSFFVQAWLLQYSRRSFFYSAYRSLRNTTCLGSMGCRSPMIPWYVFKWFAKVQRSFPSPEKFSFCTDEIESIEWLDLVPRQRTGDCSVIHHH